MSDAHEVGPLLLGVLDAELRADEALTYPNISRFADAVVQAAREIGQPVLMPVGADGQRILGAVALRCEGEIEHWGWRTSIRGRDVLLVAVTGVSDLESAAAAESALRLGARTVHLCAVDPAVLGGTAVDSFTSVGLFESDINSRRSA